MYTRQHVVIAGSIAATTSLVVMVVARLQSPFPILLADRFVPGLGWLQIGLLVAYSVVVAVWLSRARHTARVRLAIWLAFSVVFFSQFIIGLLGIDELLMTGRLHIPVPAVVIAGPIYRGARFFMPILFTATVVLCGPAWCSYLCYFGAWDGLAATRQRKSSPRQPQWSHVRLAVLVIVPAAAIALRAFGLEDRVAALAAIGFGVIGLVISIFFSTRHGVMIHCTGYCPLGVVANTLGKVSPFRVRITEKCTACGKCTAACRYDALPRERIVERRPGFTCSLCGDCLSACADNAIVYSIFRLDSANAKAVFMGLVAALHACFLGIARI